MAIVLHSSLRLEGYLTWMKNHQLDRGGLPSENIGEKIERKGGRLYIAAYISGCKCNCFRLILSSVQWCSLLLYGCFLLIWVSLFFNLRQLPSVIYIYAHVFNHLPKCFGICIHVIFFSIIMFIHLFLIHKCVVIIVSCLLIFFLKSFMLLFSDLLRAILPICFSILIARFYCWFDIDFLLHNEIKKVLFAFKFHW